MIGFFIAMLIMLSAVAGASYYIAHRIYQGLVSFFPNLLFWPVLMFFFAMALALLLGFSSSMLPFSGGVKQLLGLVSAYCMGIFLYLLLFSIAADLLVLVFRLLRFPFTSHQHFQGFVTLGILLLTALTCLYGFYNARQIDLVSYEVSMENKRDISDLNLVMISDLHLGAVGSEDRLEEIVGQINALEPDVVCIAGDFFDTDFASIRDPEAAIETLQKIRSTFGTYACLGNHDAGQTFPQMVSFLEQANINLLQDEYTVIDDRLVLVGRLDASPIGGYGGITRKELSEFFTLEDPTLPVIVLDHNPANIHSYSSDADLILSGHTHKGQVFPANLITNAMYTVDHGYYRKDAQSPHVIVTSGVGTWGMPMRVGSDCEIVTVRFTCSQ